jgi:hypothetical protein
MTISLTNDVTIDPNAAPIITPTARSITFPRIANFLNSCNMTPSLSEIGTNSRSGWQRAVHPPGKAK